MSERDRKAHLNLVDSSRTLFELDRGAVIEAADGWLFGAGRSPHPAISNAAFRRDDGVDAEDFLSRAMSFFGDLGRGFSVWARSDLAEDRDLVAGATAAGLTQVHQMPEMLRGEPVDEPVLPEGAELRRVSSRSEAEDYWRVAASSYSSLGFPPEVFAYYEDHEGLSADNVAAFLAHMGDEPVAIAMTIVSHGVAGIYWVGCIEDARGKGLGRAMTAVATNAGFDLGAHMASLQASTMGEGIYAAMGYRTVYDYRLLMAPPSQTGEGAPSG